MINFLSIKCISNIQHILYLFQIIFVSSDDVNKALNNYYGSKDMIILDWVTSERLY